MRTFHIELENSTLCNKCAKGIILMRVKNNHTHRDDLSARIAYYNIFFKDHTQNTIFHKCKIVKSCFIHDESKRFFHHTARKVRTVRSAGEKQPMHFTLLVEKISICTTGVSKEFLRPHICHPRLRLG